MSHPVDPTPDGDGDRSPRRAEAAINMDGGGDPVASATVSPSQSQSQVQTFKPPRRKLQKGAANKPRSLWSKRASQDSTASSSLECGGTLATRHPSSCEQPNIPMPPDLSDSKWLEYIERSRLMSSPDLSLGLGSGAKVVTEAAQSSISELSSLALNRPRSRPSVDSSPLSPSTMSKPRKPMSKRGFMGPPFKIAQLDGSAPRKKEIRVVKRKPSVELIADQYQAFLESRDAEDDEEQQKEERSEDEVPAAESTLLEPTRFDPYEASPRRGSLDRPREVTVDAPGPAEPSDLSPASDGTLVAFEEDAIYFKPISFSPESSPQPERQSFDKPLPRPPSNPGNQPLQICVAMLVRELTAALPTPSVPKDQPHQTLQISVMIEAYERLRDQVSNMSLGESEQRNIRTMFDCWLATLHTLHRSFAGGASVSERQYEDLAEEVD